MFLELVDVVRLMKTCKGLLDGLRKNDIWKKFNKITGEININHLINMVLDDEIIRVKTLGKNYSDFYFLTCISHIIVNGIKTNMHDFTIIENQRRLCKIYDYIGYKHPFKISRYSYINNIDDYLFRRVEIKINKDESIDIIRVRINEKVYDVYDRYNFRCK